MRLVFVHGIKHEGKSSDWIKTEWLNCLSRSLSRQDENLLRSLPLEAPFYGDVLHAKTEQLPGAATQLTEQSANAASSDEADFYAEVLAEVAAVQPEVVAPAIITEEAFLVQQGFNPHNRHLLAVVRAFETISPLHGDAVLRLLPQAFTYLRRQEATEAVDNIVRPTFAEGPCIVVAHSLGTVVTFKLMREAKQTVPFYLTMGCPLAIKAVQKPLKIPYGKRPETAEWLNAYDRDDFVTIGRPLNGNFGTGMSDIAVSNKGDDAHSHAEYLAQPKVGAALIAAIKANH